jgi:hypothetical protein
VFPLSLFVILLLFSIFGVRYGIKIGLIKRIYSPFLQLSSNSDIALIIGSLSKMIMFAEGSIFAI